MKKYILTFGVITLAALNACQDLDREIVTTLDAEQANTVYGYTKNRIDALYTYLPNGFTEIDGAMMASAGDEAEHTLEASAIHQFNAGSWNAVSNPDNAWAGNFRAIRSANLFLANSDNVNLESFRLDPTKQGTYTARVAEIKRWKYEARFLRAFFYFELIKRYGGVPVIKNVIEFEDDYSSLQRQSLQECVQFISDECDSAATVLPAKYPDGELGRVTKGAALALKAKVLLYAASDLWNDPSWAGSYADLSLISLPAGDRAARWKAAADAAKAVIDLPGTTYSLYSNYRNLFITSQGYQSMEHILVRRNGNSNDFERANFPFRFEGQTGTAPSGNLVDAYEVKVDANTAVPFDWNNPSHAANPYATSGSNARDPRLFMNVVVNNSSFKGSAIELWNGGLDGKGKPLAPRTGYYLRKYVDEGVNLLTGTTSVHSWDIIRLADVYLWYAEALNEYSPGHADVLNFLNKVRTRPGVAMPAVQAGLTQTQMRSIIRHERLVELAFEGHRFWDVRRWMIAASALGSPVKGVEITKEPSGTFTYASKDIETRVFENKMYFYPIPQAEILQMPNWKQNPLW